LEREILWRLEGETLFQISEGLPPFPIPLAEVSAIRLHYSPTRFQTGRYRCELKGGRWSAVSIQNEHYRGVADFEDRSETYRALVLALLHRRAALGTGCRYLGGVSVWVWLLNAAILFGGLFLLGFVLFTLGSGSSEIVAVKLMVVVVLLPFGIRWIIQNRPSTFDPGSVPKGLLPPGGD